jgi:hypothetical protein
MALSEGELPDVFCREGAGTVETWEMPLDGAKEHEVSST